MGLQVSPVDHVFVVLGYNSSRGRRSEARRDVADTIGEAQ